MNSHLTDAQVVVLQDLFYKDADFRSTIQRRFAQEADEAEKRASNLKSVLTGFEGENSTSSAGPAPVKEGGARRGRPRGTTTESSKMGAVVTFLSKNPNSSTAAITSGLEKGGIKMDNAMLNSYLYQLKKRGDVISSGERGSRTYSAAGKPARKAK